MPATILPQLDPWVPPPETTSPLCWAPLISIDLSKFDSDSSSSGSAESKRALAAELKAAATTDGFWTVTGSGIPQETIDRQFAIADAFFKLGLEEKRAVRVDYNVERHFGYQEPRNIVKDGQSIKQNLEVLHIPKLSSNVPIHDFTNAFHSEISAFQKLCYDNVLKKLLVLFAIMLELPEDYFVERHRFEGMSEDDMRMMKYHARPETVDRVVSGQWITGHTGGHTSSSFPNPNPRAEINPIVPTDFGSITLLFPQNVAALQIQTPGPSHEWKWVKPVKGGITCNAGDVMSFLTKGYIKSSIHRVVRPPPDQAHLDRIGVIYFLRPGNETPMIPAPSPVLLREGFVSEKDMDVSGEGGEGQKGGEVVSGVEYVRARVKHVNDRYTWRVDEGKPEQVFKVKGLSVRDYYV